MLRRSIPLTSLLFILAACQTVDPASTVKKVVMNADGAGELFRERRGWRVDYVAASSGAPAHCRGRRIGGRGLDIVFIGAEKESGFHVLGVSPTGSGDGARRDGVVAVFDGGDRHEFEARREDGALAVVVATDHYEDALHPFARAKTVNLKEKRGAVLGELPLTGSSWAINATDECRRMRIPSRLR